ncbi:PEP-CTERM sorting domain-containing protein [Alteromonas sp. M12]|uniref:PEP-CTERM sorting domain-containing protein n=1 Tax=Alteromonas sp. M12 TaxID=3135644 RepID=UPI00319E4783
MQYKKSIGTLVTTFSLVLFSAFSHATILTLNDISTNYRFENLPSYSESGFNISVNCSNCVNVFSTEEAMSGFGALTASAGWGADGRFLETWNTSSVFSLTLNSGLAFDFIGLDIGWFSNSVSNASWNVRAFDKAGNQIGAQDNYTGIGTFAMNYYNVYKVELQNNDGYSSFDNLQVAPVSVSVPEPEGLMLLGCALLFVSLSRRQKAQSR